MATSYQQLRMVWPEHRLGYPPTPREPPGHSLRTFRAGDEERFFRIMELSGWPGWDRARLAPWAARIVPDGWYVAVHDATDKIVATAMGLREPAVADPSAAELGWVASDPAHRGFGLGMAVGAAVTARLIDLGYRDIHLYTEDFRLAALKTYLKLGYEPVLFAPEMPERWERICTALGWPYTPGLWPT